MLMHQNEPLKNHTSMQIGGKARFMAEVKTYDDLTTAIEFAKKHNLPIKVIGGGSNIIFSDKGFPGLIIQNAIGGLHLTGSTIMAGSGVAWDDVVARTVEFGLVGIEALSKIPGSAGAAPVQNIGAYGQELASTFVELEAFDSKKMKFVRLGKKELDFSYRSSILKRRPELIVTAITLELADEPARVPEYRDVTGYFEKHRKKSIGPAEIRAAVTEIRAKKLPDPSVVPNCGSFFHNPILTPEAFARLEVDHPQINDTPEGWPQPPRWLLPDDHVKISAAWLLEQTGFKRGSEVCGLRLWKNQALVLTNPGKKKWTDLMCAVQEIIAAVKKDFGISLATEPELVI